MAKIAFPKIDGYVVTEKIGSGSYSTVYKAYNKIGAKMTVAIKCVDKSSIKNSGSAVDNLISEIRLLKTLRHPHIVQMHNFTWDDKNIYIIMEYCCGGDLSRYIKKYGRVPEKEVLYFLQQLASALKFLREKGVVHMDLKPHNLLLHKDSDLNYVLKVADFGFAAHMLESGRGVRGSPLYMAPEVLTGDYGPAVDLWSVGVIMYECLFGRAPYASNTFKELLDKIEKRAPIEVPPHSSISPGCRRLLSRLLRHDPRERISYEEFFNDPYLDLEHMPSKENYEKAVQYIQRAVELECSGSLQAALAHYTAALALLVPRAHRERDPVRKAALTHKLHRYMERAEDIKRILKGETIAQPNIGNDTSRNVVEVRHPQVIQDPELKEDVGKVEEPVLEPDNERVEQGPSASASGAGAVASKPRFAFRRLFSRTPVPLLDAKDPCVTTLQSEDKEKDKPDLESNDTCRIT